MMEGGFCRLHSAAGCISPANQSIVIRSSAAAVQQCSNAALSIQRANEFVTTGRPSIEIANHNKQHRTAPHRHARVPRYPVVDEPPRREPLTYGAAQMQAGPELDFRSRGRGLELDGCGRFDAMFSSSHPTPFSQGNAINRGQGEYCTRSVADTVPYRYIQQ